MLSFLSIVSISFSQMIDNDTLTIKIIKKITKSPWGMKFGIGGLYHQMPNQNYINNKLAFAGSISLFYNHIFIRGEVFSIDFSPNDYIYFGKYLFSTKAEFTSINLNTELGYCINFNKKWSSDFRIGMNFTDFNLVNSEELGVSYTSETIAGVLFGITLERYFKLNVFRYLVLGLNIDYYSTNYGSISPDLNRGSINYSLTAAYKFWYQRSLDALN
jgi:hypothetical protein